MAEWYYSEFGQTKGPFSKAKIVDLVLKQELEPDSYVMSDRDHVWTRIREIPELEEELHKPVDLPHVEKFPDSVVEGGYVEETRNLYFHIPIRRLIILNILSGGLYQLYWFYRQWRFWSEKHKQGHQSFDREAARIFFVLSILNKIETDRELNAVCRADFNGNRLFWMWVVFGLAGYAFYTLTGISNVLHEVFFMLTLVIDVIFLLPVQRYINRVNEKLGNPYARFGFWEYLAIALGLFPLLILLIFLPFKLL